MIIPAYNEEATVADVVKAAREAGPLVGQVIVVDDGSNDNTSEQAQQAGAEVLRLPYNSGKVRALLAGAEAAVGEILVFLDADLVGITPHHLGLLALPLIHREADMTVGVFRRGRLSTDLAQALAPWLSGQRGLSRELFLRARDRLGSGFAAEVGLSLYAKRQGLRVVQVPLEGVTHRTKEEKRGFWPGVGARMRMYLDIWRALTQLPHP